MLMQAAAGHGKFPDYRQWPSETFLGHIGIRALCNIGFRELLGRYRILLSKLQVGRRTYNRHTATRCFDASARLRPLVDALVRVNFVRQPAHLHCTLVGL